MLAVAVLVAGLGLSAYLVAAERRSAADADERRIAGLADANAAALADTVDDIAELLTAAAAFQSPGGRDMASFVAFTERLLHEDSPARYVSYVVPVRPGDVAALAAERRQQGQPHFEVAPGKPDGRYHVVLFSGPETTGTDGVDLGHVDGLTPAFDRAAATGEPVITEPFVRVQDRIDDEGILSVALYVPVFRAGAGTATAEQRSSALLGWVATAVPVAELLHRAGIPESAEVRVSVRDSERPDVEVAAVPARATAVGDLARTVEVELLDQRWQLEVAALPTFVRAGDSGIPVGATSVLASIALAGLVLAVARQRYRLTARVAEAVAQVDASERRFRAVFDNAPVGAVVTDMDGEVVEANRAFVELLGSEPSRQNIVESFLPEDLEQVRPTIAALRSGEIDQAVVERQLLRPDGSTVWCRVTSATLPGEGAMIALVHDITAERAEAAAAEKLQVRRARFEAMVERSDDLVAVLDAKGRIGYASPAIGALYGFAPADVVGASPLEVVHPDDRPRVAAALDQVLASAGGHGSIRYRVVLPSGEVRVVEVSTNNLLDDPDVGGVVTRSRDVTAQSEADDALRQRAFSDALTGLPTRDVLLEQLGVALDTAARADGTVAVLFVDLDRFKQVNDRFGHAAGDALLLEVARALGHAVRPGDMVVRHGGDEFVVLLESVRNEAEARAVAERARQALRRPVVLPGGVVVEPGASVGVALSDGSTTPDAMLRDADSALYRAKKLGRDRVEVFDETLRLRALRRLDTELVLRQALEQDSLSLRFEPVVDLVEGGVVGAEARVRLSLPNGEHLSAGELLPVAQEAGLVTSLTAESLEAACRAVVAWSAHSGPRWVGVDVSAGEVTHPSFVPRLAHVLDLTGVEAGAVRLELPVDVVVNAATLTRRAIAAARALGVHVVLDGVGAELRALAALGGLEVDGLKLDLASLPDMVDDPVAAAVAASVAEVAAAAGLPVVVVGADSAAQLDAVRQLGFRYVQGAAVSPVLDARGLLV